MKYLDDFNWESYTTDFYEREMVDILIGRDNLDLLIENSTFDGSSVIYNDNLHDNWKELYNQICSLSVSSVFECGVGCGHHLINIQRLLPNVVVNGCDYSQSQIDLGFKYFGLADYDFSSRLKVRDFCKEDATQDFEVSDFVYTQAVTMHLSYDKAKKFLQNMGKLSNKYIYLIENINAHEYTKLLEEALPEFSMIESNKYYIDTAILLERK